MLIDSCHDFKCLQWLQFTWTHRCAIMSTASKTYKSISRISANDSLSMLVSVSKRRAYSISNYQLHIVSWSSQGYMYILINLYNYAFALSLWKPLRNINLISQLKPFLIAVLFPSYASPMYISHWPLTHWFFFPPCFFCVCD